MRLSGRPRQRNDKLVPVVEITTMRDDISCTVVLGVIARAIVTVQNYRNDFSPVNIPRGHRILFRLYIGPVRQMAGLDSMQPFGVKMPPVVV